MTEEQRIDKFAEELLAKTLANKLQWRVPSYRSSGEAGKYVTDIGDGLEFEICKSLTTEIPGQNPVTNFVLSLKNQSNSHPIAAWISNAIGFKATPDRDQAKTFRTYSDLYDAAHESTFAIEDTFKTAEELLRKIG